MAQTFELRALDMEFRRATPWADFTRRASVPVGFDVK